MILSFRYGLSAPSSSTSTSKWRTEHSARFASLRGGYLSAIDVVTTSIAGTPLFVPVCLDNNSCFKPSQGNAPPTTIRMAWFHLSAM